MKKKKRKIEKIDNKKVRFSDAPWAKSTQHIVVGGAGGIGSWASLYLARIGHSLHIYDMDTIEETNIGGQLYAVAQIGQNKAEATKETIINFCGEEASIHTYGRFDRKNGMCSPIMVSCFDNMSSRRNMFEVWKKQEDRLAFIDGRMLAEVGNVFLVQKGQEEKYEEMLFDDSEVEEVACSFKATSHCGGSIGALMVSILNNFLTNKVTGFDDRIVNFQTDFEMPLLTSNGYELKNS